MRIKNSFAAAVAAVVFSAAFQPVEAALVTIDDFTQATGTTSASTTSTGFFQSSTTAAITGPLFDTRVRSAAYTQALSPRQLRDVFTSVGSGVGTLRVFNSGTTTPNVALGGDFLYVNSGNTAVDLLAATAGDFQGFKIVTGATNSLSPAATGLVSAFIRVENTTAGKASNFSLPGGAFWAPNTTYFIPFSSFSGDVDFASVTRFYLGFETADSIPGNSVYDVTAQFTLIAVPEPTQMVSVAAVGAIYGAWRLRRRGRNRMTAGAATAG